MIPLVPIVIGALATIGIGSAVASFIYGELTAEQKILQKEMQDDLASLERDRQNRLQKILEQFEIDESTFLESRDERIVSARKQYFADRQAQSERHIERYITLAHEQIKITEGIRKEIEEGLNRLRTLRRTQKTILRQEAMEHLERELNEAKNKAYGYVQYLKQYEKQLRYRRSQVEEEDLLFSLKLPEDYPYIGKLLFFKKNLLEESLLQHHSRHFISIKYDATDKELLQPLDDEAVVPVIVTEFNRTTYSYDLSIGKGSLKHIAINQSKIGVEAMVKEHTEKKLILLDYKGVTLKLHRKNLENPRKVPPIGAKLRVYPTNWDFALYHPVFVTENYQDSLKSFQFDTLPIVFSAQGTEEFITFLEENGFSNEADEWKIGPIDETSSLIKLQLGDKLIFAVRFIEGARSYFYFEGMLPLEDSFKPEDVFVVMDAEFEMVEEQDIELLSESAYEHMLDLSIMLFKEFKIQQQLNASMEGLSFFTKWTEVTEKLVQYLSKGKEVICDLSETAHSYRLPNAPLFAHEYELLNAEEVRQRLTDLELTGMVEFIVEVNKNQYMSVEFDETVQNLRIYTEASSLVIPTSQLKVYVKNFCYPEIQQLNALNTFRSGQLVNGQLQSYTLNSKNIESQKAIVEEINFKNERLTENLAQKEAVEQALQEENIYLVQGPPGTGKTTVIRELMAQYLERYPSARILIVSQANVAIDNVLKGFGKQYEDQMIRCGNVDKIDSQLTFISFDTKYNAYVEKIAQKEEIGPQAEFLTKWKSLIGCGQDRANPIMGELLVKNHQIVGATCLGLMQRKIGLDRVEFDLVIIDEAGKALPAELLIPLNKAKKVVLIGDHKQLPPVVHPALYDTEKIELENRSYCVDDLFATSLFKRLYENCPDTNKQMLNTQYRMPAVIGSMISKFFYEGQLLNGQGTEERPTKYFNRHLNILDLSDEMKYRESTKDSAVTNVYEAQLVAKLVKQVRAKLPMQEKIAVICPYRGQMRCIREALRKEGVDWTQGNIAVNTIDAYQGDEAELVIFCMTRSLRKTPYFSDEARLNVALSRVKNDLLIIGSLRYLQSYGESHILHKIAQYITDHGAILKEEDVLEGELALIEEA
ncbi:Superfamily I DNA and/or RNA helicase [Bacillus sp. OV322]|uniref:DEAD/DEAH box helicase n=1 Tax=Bacillus sp. OV322 TaxID=1882764 RepID=UPI0008F0795B|nr:AAA domain-containing protein [Bacillus sp. OV322]SFC09399.1 Superfamily I DNA and/or RNA helicase [Bacillus sp. OV322]